MGLTDALFEVFAETRKTKKRKISWSDE